MPDFILFIVFVLEIVQLCLCISILRTEDESKDLYLDLEREIRRIESRINRNNRKVKK